MREVEIWGHRGARGMFPENTIEGFRAALALGVRAFELDVGVTADGIPVVCHDLVLNPDIARVEGEFLALGHGPTIRSLTLRDLERYDVGWIRPGSPYAAQFPDQARIDGARVPTLAAVLALDPGAKFIIELKTDPRHPDWTVAPSAMADLVLAAVDAAGARGKAVFESFDWRGPRHLRRSNPGLCCAWLTREETVADAAIWWDGIRPDGSVPHAAAAAGGGIWAPEHVGLTRAAIAEAHDLGLAVISWTVNDPADMRRLVAWGIDGLITDFPDRARQSVLAGGDTIRSPA